MKPVSVIIPTYNRAALVVCAVDSVLAQTWSDFELIVVDDGSTDDTLKVLEKYEGITLIKNPVQSGVSAARNMGISASAGSLVAFLDSDDSWLPEKLERQVKFFDDNPDALICQTEETWYRNGVRVNPKKKHRKPSGDIFFESLELCLVSPSAVMMKRELLDLVGVFDEALPACEDYDLWLRVSARYPVYIIDEPLIIKTGGHEDQLSRAWGLDKYRVQAILKILFSGILSDEQARAARIVLARKAGIYGQGCIKRNKPDEGKWYLDLADKINQELKI